MGLVGEKGALVISLAMDGCWQGKDMSLHLVVTGDSNIPHIKGAFARRAEA